MVSLDRRSVHLTSASRRSVLLSAFRTASTASFVVLQGLGKTITSHGAKAAASRS